MKRRWKAVLYGVLVFAALAFAVNLPNMIEATRQKTNLEALFSRYSLGLVSGDYDAAYAMCDPEFQKVTPITEFYAQRRSVESELGKLKRISNEGIYLHGKGSPLRWVGLIHQKEIFEKGEIDLVCEYHLEQVGWRLYGCTRP